jgi:hypothetical protein
MNEIIKEKHTFGVVEKVTFQSYGGRGGHAPKKEQTDSGLGYENYMGFEDK